MLVRVWMGLSFDDKKSLEEQPRVCILRLAVRVWILFRKLEALAAELRENDFDGNEDIQAIWSERHWQHHIKQTIHIDGRQRAHCIWWTILSPIFRARSIRWGKPKHLPVSNSWLIAGTFLFPVNVMFRSFDKWWSESWLKRRRSSNFDSERRSIISGINTFNNDITRFHHETPTV